MVLSTVSSYLIIGENGVVYGKLLLDHCKLKRMVLSTVSSYLIIGENGVVYGKLLLDHCKLKRMVLSTVSSYSIVEDGVVYGILPIEVTAHLSLHLVDLAESEHALGDNAS